MKTSSRFYHIAYHAGAMGIYPGHLLYYHTCDTLEEAIRYKKHLEGLGLEVIDIRSWTTTYQYPGDNIGKMTDIITHWKAE